MPRDDGAEAFPRPAASGFAGLPDTAPQTPIRHPKRKSADPVRMLPPIMPYSQLVNRALRGAGGRKKCSFAHDESLKTLTAIKAAPARSFTLDLLDGYLKLWPVGPRLLPRAVDSFAVAQSLRMHCFPPPYQQRSLWGNGWRAWGTRA
jgi:hypothetical protein